MPKTLFLNMIKDEMFKLRYAKRTIETYLKWISSYNHFHQKNHQNSMHGGEVEAFLSHLVLELDVASTTQKSALNAIPSPLIYYNQVPTYARGAPHGVSRTVQDQLGHADLRTTQIYTHILQRGGNSVVSPLSRR